MKYDVYYSKDGYTVNSQVLSSEEALVDFLFILHMDQDQEVCRESRYMTKIRPHVEVGDLVLNLNTHELRRVRVVGENYIHLNNSDYPHDLQGNGYVPIVDEVWDRADVIPVHMEEYQDRATYYYGSPLGVHPKYKEMIGLDF